MITVSVDLSYAFDYLSILEVKEDMKPSEQATLNREHQDWHIRGQLGAGGLFADILASEEYAALYEVNMEIFKLFDLAEKDLANQCAHLIEVNRLNGVVRPKCKAALQARFAPETPLTEQKFYYQNAQV